MKELTTAEQLIQQAEVASQLEERITSLNAQLADREKRLQLLDSEFAVKVERLQTDQTKKLRKALLPLEELRNTTQEEVDILISNKITLTDSIDFGKIELDTLMIDIEQTRKSLQALAVTRSEENDRFNTIRLKTIAERRTTEATRTTNTQLLQENQRLLDDNEVLKDKNVNLKDKNIELATNIAKSEAKLVASMDQYKPLIDKSQRKLDELMITEKRTREDLAIREINVENREKTVAVRERKADINDELIQRNATLLEL